MNDNNEGFRPDNFEPEKPKGPVEPMNYNSIDSNSNNYSSNNYEEKPKDKNKLIMIIGGVVILVLVIVLVVVLVGKKDSTKTVEDIEKEMQKIEEQEKKEEEELSKHYEVKTYNLADGNVLIEFENKNNVPVNAKFKVDFYDANEKLIDTKEAYLFMIKPNYKAYNDVYLISDNRNFSTFKINTTLSKSTFAEDYTDKVEVVSVNKTSSNIMAEIKSNAVKKLSSVDLVMLYYDAAGNIIGFSSYGIDDLEPGQTTAAKFGLPYDNKYDYVDYSKYELHVNSAFYSNY